MSVVRGWLLRALTRYAPPMLNTADKTVAADSVATVSQHPATQEVSDIASGRTVAVTHSEHLASAATRHSAQNADFERLGLFGLRVMAGLRSPSSVRSWWFTVRPAKPLSREEVQQKLVDRVGSLQLHPVAGAVDAFIAPRAGHIFR